MDKLNRLQALTGDVDVCGEESAFQFPAPKPQHLYEGTDSDSDEVVISRGRVILGKASEDFNPSAIQSSLFIGLSKLLPYADANQTYRKQHRSQRFFEI
jgi:hypothetical protein